MKKVCLYHSIDLDGWFSAAIVKYWWEIERNSDENILINDVVDFIGYNYGDKIPDLSRYDKVIMCDICFPVNIMNDLFKTKELIWLDHHISAIRDIDGIISEDEIPLIEGIRDIKHSACELTWKYFFPKEEIPELIRLAGRYDCYQYKGTSEEKEVLNFQFGARTYINSFEEAFSALIESRTSPYENSWIVVDSISKDGKAIYQHLCSEAKQTYKQGFEVEFLEKEYYPNGNGTGVTSLRRFICFNKDRFNPIEFGIDYHKDGYSGAACFHYDGKQWRFSLYNANGSVDCSDIAKRFGGGGHFSASGFECDEKTFLKIIKQ